MINNFRFYINYDIYCCARTMIKTNTISSCSKNNITKQNGN